MDYYGLLFLYYLKGLSGKSVLRLFFNIEAGGTEQLLPENTSVPTTTPILADIQYPDGLRTDQYFTYRKTPTTISNKARIKTIKGNTLVWNQLVQNGNFADTSLWRTYSSTGFSVSNNVGSFTVTGSIGAIYQTNTPAYVSGHKYLVIADFYVSQQSNISVEVSGTRGKTETVNANTWYRYSDIVTPSAQGNFSLTCGQGSVQVKNVMCFDLTAMGLDSITDPSDFTSLFPLPYYDFNQGSLLSFNGNGIKTVGKNLLNARTTYTSNGITFTNDNGVITINGTATANAYFTTDVNLRNGSYFISVFNDGINTNVHITIRNESGAYPLDIAMSAKNRIVSINNDIDKFIIYVRSGTTLNNFVLKPMISFESPEYFEPYIETATDLPISTYFPTGMKSAGTVYDELTPTKAIVRLIKTTVDGTNKTANYYGAFQGHQLFYIDVFAPTYVDYSNMANLKSNHYLTAINVTMNDRYIRYQASDNGANIGRIYWNDDRYTSADAINTALQSDPLEIISLAQTPTETPITTEDANEALSLLMGKSVSSSNANQLIDIITKGE